MDAARTHSTHLRLSLLVLIALTLSAPVWAQSPSFQLSSTTVTCSSTFCANPPGGQVVVGSTGAAITYSATLTYDPNDSGNNGRWLVVNPNGGGLVTGTDNGGTLNFSLGSAQGLSQGSHQATVTLHATDGSGAADATITITFQTGSGGGNGTLASTVNPINLNAAPGFSQNQQIGISTTSASSITIGVSTTTSSCTGINWLTASINGSNTISSGSSTTVNVTGNANGLTSGVCQGNVVVTPSVGTTLSIPVTFNIGSGT